MRQLRIELLGGFRVSIDGHPIPEEAWRRRKAAALIKLLALAPAHRLHREQVMDVLWPELGPEAAGANLRKALYYARRSLDTSRPGGAELISFDGDFLALAPGHLRLDVEAFRAALTDARRSGRADEYWRALELSRGDLLPDDLYEEWAEEPRRELHLEYIAALEELAGLLESRGDLDGGIEVARQLITADPLREESHVALMRLAALAGRRGEALRQYEHLRRLFESELATEPSPEAQQLYEEIRARRPHEPELTAELWERVGDLRVLAGDASGAARAFASALEAGRGSGAAARLQRKCAEAWLMQHRPDAAEPHLSEAEALATEPAEQARVVRARANLAWETRDIPAAQRYAEQAMALAREHGTPDDLAAAHEALAIVSHFKGEWREGLAAELERLSTEDVGAPQLARVLDIHHCIGQYHLYGDGLADSVEEHARRILDRAEEAGAVRAQAFAWCLLGESVLLQARWEEAAGCLARSAELHASLSSRSVALPWQRRAELAVCRGRFAEAEECVQQASAIATVSAMACHAWGRIYATVAFAAIEQGDPEQAVRAVRAAAAAAVRYGDCPTCSALLNPMAAEAFALLGDAGSAHPYAAAAGQVAQMFHSSAWRAMAESAEGSVAVAEGDERRARHHFHAARDLYERAGQSYWVQRAERLGALASA